MQEPMSLTMLHLVDFNCTDKSCWKILH